LHPDNTFPSPVLTGSGSEGMISALYLKIQIPKSKFQKVTASKRLWNLIFVIWDLPDLHRDWAPHCVKNQNKFKSFPFVIPKEKGFEKVFSAKS
jgi:hypothetical protein